MADTLTPEEIVTRIEAGLAPYHAKARIHDYQAKVSFKVWATEGGPHLYTVPDLPVHELQSPNYLADVIDGTRREAAAKAKRLDYSSS